MNFLESKRSVFLFGTFLFLLVGLIRNPTSPYDKVISGDAKAYYAYLPALFIYQDHEYKFMEQIEKKYYGGHAELAKDFVTKVDGETVNKTYPGAAILYLPFFLIAHFLSMISGNATDGYSIIYQWSIVAAHFFYFTLALLALREIWIKMHWAFAKFWLALFFSIFGTQLGFYLMLDHSLTHLFGWSLFLIIIYLMHRIYLEANRRDFALLGFTTGLALILRPTNIFFILFLPFVFNNLNWLISRWKALISWRKFIIVIATAIIPALFTVSLWYWQTGFFYVYSYGKEGFDFTNPHIINFTFGFEKGWWLYTPIAGIAIIFLSVYYFKKYSWTLSAYWLGVWLTLVYIFSSWWSWNYGSGFSQRVMIEYSVFFILPMAYVRFNKLSLAGLGLLSLLNIWQSYQVRYGVLPGGLTTPRIYWNHFFDPIKNAFCFVGDDYLEQETINLEAKKFKPKNTSFSPGWTFRFKESDSIDKIKLELLVKANQSGKGQRLVLADDKEKFYKAYFIENYLHEGSFTKLEFCYDFKQRFTDKRRRWTIYLWDPNKTSTVTLKDLKLTSFTTAEPNKVD